MSCKYYGYNGMHGALIPNPGSNQCGIIISSHAPCQEEVAGRPVDEAKCPLAMVYNSGLGTIEPDLDRTSPYHKRILETKKIEGTKAGNYAKLSCGHWVVTFGRLELSGGVAFCRDCQQNEAKQG